VKIAAISDIHGNLPALQAVLPQIALAIDTLSVGSYVEIDIPYLS
jgi:hypothetical protein